MTSQKNTQKTSSGKKPIEKIVVSGCSFSLPGQSGVKKVWSEYLSEAIQKPVINLTVSSGGSNSEILRRILEYTWNNDVSQTGFIVQWTTIDRLEYCNNDLEWYQIKKSKTVDGQPLPIEVDLKLKKIKECQAYTYSTSTHFWSFIQQVLCLDSVMKQNESKYFQVHCLSTSLNNFYHKLENNYFNKFNNKIIKNLNRTNWLFNSIMKSDLNNQGYSVINSNDPHFDSVGHKDVSKTFKTFIEKEGWL